ncbi:PilW family protein [Massilia yuzhufengensis]|uniref:Type IV pilus assembly protein PilW n=1 Tax=Massilia yuzhufengensis TaxID=1164594 RepID=A0A1I1JXZ1_9BURK|nr:PilW family protein [Massilia yuzhufengensis]SFC53559.1 type IV pilus assembly protein PilW [Massilia yuzhufengensis]
MTIAELLVAMTIGLGVLLAAGSLFIWANRAFAAQVETAAMDDAGRYALEVIARAVRQSASVDWERNSGGPDPAAPAQLAGLDARGVDRTGFAIDNAPANAIHGSDVLAVRFPGTGMPPSGDGTTLDCAGFTVHRDEEGWSIFYVARNPQGEVELRCKYRGTGAWSADAVIGAVDGFQVLYGLDADTDGTPERYVNASALAGLDAGLALAGATAAERDADLRRRTHWKKVASVRVALLLHGPASRLQTAQDASYDLFGRDYGDMAGEDDAGTRLDEADLSGSELPRYRKVFGTTIALPARSH